MTTQGIILLPSSDHSTNDSPVNFSTPHLSEKPSHTRFKVPPYLPISGGFSTSGFSGSRSSTGGSFPCLTSFASIGASLYFCACDTTVNVSDIPITAMNGRHLAIGTPQILPLDRHLRPFTPLPLEPFIMFEGRLKNQEIPVERI